MNQIRFVVLDGEKIIHETPWHPENGKDDALRVMTDVRKELGGNYAYRIERTGDSKQPNPVKQYRYKILSGENTYYSKLVQEKDKDELLAKVREEFPKEKIIEEAF
jgi:hypothetical protein